MAVTIKQIAELANVSRGTVDKVLNNRPGVKAETKEKVLRIAREMNYHPNLLGKALVQNGSSIKFGIILTAGYNPHVQELMAGIHSAVEEFQPFGVEVLTRMLTSFEPVEQLSIINELIGQDIRGLAVFPIDDPQIIHRINELTSQKLPVLTFNSKVKETNPLCFVGQDHYKGGRTAAELLRKIVPGEIHVGVIASSRKLTCHQDRVRGFSDYMKQLSGEKVSVIDIQENQDKKEDAFSITLTYLNKYPALNAIYITGGGVAGVGSALEIARPDHHVHVICHDLTPDSIELLNSGTVDFVLGQDPHGQGYQLVKILFEYCMKGITPPSEIDFPISITVKESL